MTVKNYETLEITVIAIQEDVIRTSNFTTSEAPDVYEPDPFIKG